MTTTFPTTNPIDLPTDQLTVPPPPLLLSSQQHNNVFRSTNMEDEKKNQDNDDQKGEPNSIPTITGDFATWSQDQVITYFLQLNDPTKPLYEKDELASLHLNQLRAWATKAYQIKQAYELQGKVEPQQKWIPAKEGKVPMPLGQEVDHILKERARITKMEALLAQSEQGKQDQQQQQPQQRVRFPDGGNNNNNNDVQNGANNPPPAQQQQRKQGVKRSFEDCYAPMPVDEKYEEVSTAEAAKFFNGGFASVKEDVEALMGVQFFRVKDGNGQVYYMKKDRNGNERIKKLHQKKRPTGFDTDDDVDDDGFQDQLSRDPFFRYNRRNYGAPPKKKPKVSFGHMVRDNFLLLFLFVYFYVLYMFARAFGKIILPDNSGIMLQFWTILAQTAQIWSSPAPEVHASVHVQCRSIIYHSTVLDGDAVNDI